MMLAGKECIFASLIFILLDEECSGKCLNSGVCVNG
jgi:hypothetical protein